MRLIPINTASKLQIPLHMLKRMHEDITSITHHPHRLHAHDHVLQYMTMDHPHARLGDAQAPSTPAHVDAWCRVLGVFVQHCGVSFCEGQA